MSLYKLIVRLLLLASLAFAGRTAIAGPLHCAYGNQDSTCVPTISAAMAGGADLFVCAGLDDRCRGNVDRLPVHRAAVPDARRLTPPAHLAT